jgi:hypothetical protein
MSSLWVEVLTGLPFPKIMSAYTIALFAGSISPWAIRVFVSSSAICCLVERRDSLIFWCLNLGSRYKYYCDR